MLLVLSDSSAVILPSSKSPLSVSALRSVSSPSVCLVPVGGVHWYAVRGGLQGRDKAIISANETALSQSTNVPASAAAPDRVCWSVSPRVSQCLRGKVRKVRQRSFLASECHLPPQSLPLPTPFVQLMVATESSLSKDQSQLLVFKRRTSFKSRMEMNGRSVLHRRDACQAR